jgi:hypothetical protein
LISFVFLLRASTPFFVLPFFEALVVKNHNQFTNKCKEIQQHLPHVSAPSFPFFLACLPLSDFEKRVLCSAGMQLGKPSTQAPPASGE